MSSVQQLRIQPPTGCMPIGHHAKCCVEMEGNREGEENQCMKDGRARAHPAETEQNTRGLLSTSDEMLHRDIGKHHLSLTQPKRLVALPSPQECSAFSQPVS